MSEYGPALFVARADGESLDETEQTAIGEKIVSLSAEFGLKDEMEDQPVEPFFYDYDEYEKLAVSYVIWADYTFGQAPDFIQEDMNADAESLGKKFAKKFEEEFPGTYSIQCYIVEV